MSIVPMLNTPKWTLSLWEWQTRVRLAEEDVRSNVRYRFSANSRFFCKAALVRRLKIGPHAELKPAAPITGEKTDFSLSSRMPFSWLRNGLIAGGDNRLIAWAWWGTFSALVNRNGKLGLSYRRCIGQGCKDAIRKHFCLNIDLWKTNSMQFKRNCLF